MKRILYVEDNLDTAQAVKFVLSEAGFKTEIALSGKEGLKKAEEAFDLFLLDVMLPDMAGWDVFDRLQNKKAKFAFISAIPISQERFLELKKVGVSAYFTKPFSKKELVEGVKKILNDQAL